MSTACSIGLPRIRPASTPPANASPAPLLSTMSSTLGVGCVKVCVPFCTARIVDSLPCVMSTVRGLSITDGWLAIACAISPRSRVSRLDACAHASASDSLPITSSA